MLIRGVVGAARLDTELGRTFGGFKRNGTPKVTSKSDVSRWVWARVVGKRKTVDFILGRTLGG